MTEDPSTTPSGSELTEPVLDGSNTLTNVLKKPDNHAVSINWGFLGTNSGTYRLEGRSSPPRWCRWTKSQKTHRTIGHHSPDSSHEWLHTRFKHKKMGLWQLLRLRVSEPEQHCVISLTRKYPQLFREKLQSSLTMCLRQPTWLKRALTNIHHRRLQSFLASQVSMKRCGTCFHVHIRLQHSPTVAWTTIG